MTGRPPANRREWTCAASALAGMAALACALLLAACSEDRPVDASRYAAPDELYSQLLAGVKASTDLAYLVDIDHSRLAGEQGVTMPPAHVLMVSDPQLQAAMVSRHQLLALELPLRALAYEDAGGEAAVLRNTWDNIAARHAVAAPELDAAFEASMDQLLGGVAPGRVRTVPESASDDDSIVTFTSVHDFNTTVARARDAINAQGDTVWFGEVDFRAGASELGVDLRPTRLLLFGAPEPGGRAMAGAPALGLDAFCQKLLIWQGEDGRTRISFNDLLTLAERQQAPVSMALRVINFRIKSTYEAVAGRD